MFFKVYENVDIETRMTSNVQVILEAIKWQKKLEKILQLCKIDRFDFVVLSA